MRTLEQELEVDKASANADSNRLRTIVCAEFLQDVLEVCFDRLFRDKELFGNIPISISVRQLTKNVQFAGSKLFVAVMLGQLSRYLGRNLLLSCMNLANYSHQFVRR